MDKSVLVISPNITTLVALKSFTEITKLQIDKQTTETRSQEGQGGETTIHGLGQSKSGPKFWVGVRSLLVVIGSDSFQFFFSTGCATK